MNIKALLESSAHYVNRQKEANNFVSDFRGSGLLEGLKNEQEVGTMAVMLHNQAKRLLAESNTTGTSAPGYHGENWNNIALPLVRRVFSEIKSKDFLSVQPMSMPSGLIFYLDIKYGNGKAPFVNGTSLYGNQSELHPNVKDLEVAGGLFGAGRFGYSLNQFSAAVTATVTPATLDDVNFDGRFPVANLRKVTVPTPVDAELSGVRAFLVSSATVPTSSVLQQFTKVVGANTVFITNAVAAITSAGTLFYNKLTTATSRGDFEDNSTTAVPNAASTTKIVIPELDIKLKQESIIAKTRKLKAQWTPEFQQDLDAYHNIDAESELTSMLSQYITMEIDLELIDMLMDAAATKGYWSAKNNTFWNGTAFETANTGVTTAAGFTGYYNQQSTWFQTIGTVIQTVSNKIRRKTMISGANFLLIPVSIATIFESMSGFASDATGDESDFGFGVQKIGSFNSRYKVYVNPFIEDNTILMGYKGAQFAETGAAYCPYIPLLMTPTVYDPETFTPRKGLMTRYAKKVVRPEYYGKVHVADLQTMGF